MTITARLAAAALGLALMSQTLATPARAAGEGVAPPMIDWSFDGPFGTFDRAQLQRGFKVFSQVCVACHGLELLSFRNLAEPGGPEFPLAEVREIAQNWVLQVKDIDEQGNPKERPPRLADRFPYPFANEAAGRAANNGAYPPDLSVIAKARTYKRGFPWWITDVFTQYTENGPDYLAALLKGYEDPPAGFQVPEGSYYNRYFPGHVLAMAPPLVDGQLEYTDGTPATVENYAEDVTAFLAWAADPHMEARKRLGLQVMLFLIVFTGLLYFTKQRVWADAKAYPTR